MSQSAKKRRRSASASVPQKKARAPTIAMQVEKKIAQKAEKKWIDLGFSGNMVARNDSTLRDLSPATFLALNTCQIGTDTGQRVGKKLSIVSIHVRGSIRFLGKEASVASDQPSPPSGKTVWVDLIWDKQNDGRTTAVDTSEIYSIKPISVLAGGTMLRNPDYTDQYKVLRTFRYDLPARPFLKEVVAAATPVVADLYSWPEHIIHFEFYHKFAKPLKVRYSGNTGNIGDIIDHAFHICGGYGTESETDSAPVITYGSRVKFIDV